MGKLNDLVGKRFGYLTVLYRDEDQVSKSGKRRVRWACKCDCGNEISVISDNLTTGKTRSCGCMKQKMRAVTCEYEYVHNTRLYGIWNSMKDRCFNENAAPYKHYGGRGISVCDEWKHNFKSFREWAYSNGYEENLTIDRIDNNDDYSPSNCRWVDRTAQANNRRSNRLLTYNGETHNVTQWASILNVNASLLFNRVYAGKTVDEILAV